MKIFEDRDDVEVGGALAVDSFTIRASAQAFKILSNALYANKPGAVIRELSTNAYDAHIMVGTPEVPFELTLPNSLEPTFKIRDFGPGLSEQDISSIYTTFFESTKSNSNDFVGCLGLGSKSPFAVSDSFTISSFFNGKKIIYSAFLSDARIPSIAKFAEFPTDEPNGLEIEVAIKEQDFYTFSREVNSQLKYFKVKPTIFGASDFEWHAEEEYLYEGDNWKLVKGHGSPRVVQGQIQYPISPRDMGSFYTDASDAVRTLLDKPVLFEVPIGEVDIAPSREALSYDERTCKNIVAQAEKIVEALPLMIKEVVEGCSSRYEARIKYKDIIASLNNGYYSKNCLVQKIIDSGHGVWNGLDITSTDISIPEEKISHAVCFTKNNSGGMFRKSNYHALTTGYDTGGTTLGKTWSFDASDLDYTIWVYSTTDDASVDARAKQYATKKFGLRPSCGHGFKMNVIRTEMTPVELAECLGIDESTLVIASELEKVKRAAIPAKDKKMTTVEFFAPSQWGYTKSSFWKSEEILVDDLDGLEGYFVELDRYNVLKPDGKHENDLKAFVASAIEVGLIDKSDNVYGLRKAVGKLPHTLINLFEYVVEQAKTAHLSVKYDGLNSTVVNKLSNNTQQLNELIALLDDTSPASELLKVLVKSVESPYSQNARRFISAMNLHSEVVDCSHLSEKMDVYYPMIGQMGYYLETKIVAEYIRQMDFIRSL
jgi:hypothetical protein